MFNAQTFASAAVFFILPVDFSLTCRRFGSRFTLSPATDSLVWESEGDGTKCVFLSVR